MLSFNDLTISNTEKDILQNISFSILPGGMFNFYGPNGIGKTSFLNTIAFALSNPNKVLFKGENLDINQSTYIPLNMGCYPSLPVKENLEIFAALNDNHLALAPSVKVFELDQYLDSELQSLSTGWQKRVLLATLLFTNTPIWIIDEPFSNLDPDSTQRVYEVLLSRAANGGIILISSHIPLQFDEITNINLEDFRC